MHAPATQDAPLSVKDLLQARFLSRLFAQKVGQAADRLVLKGGVAMRVAHDSFRHTKDVDLDADHDLSLASVQQVVRRAIKDATGGGWIEGVTVSEPKQTGTTARWKIQGTLPGSQVTLHLTVEVSFRHAIQAAEVRHVPVNQEQGGTVDIPVYTDEVLLLNKAAALLSPHRDAPRDVVDLFILFQGGVSVSPQVLKDHLGERSSADLVRELWAKLDCMDEERFKIEVLPNWDTAQAVAWSDWSAMRLCVGEHLEALLTGEDPPPTRAAATRHRSP